MTSLLLEKAVLRYLPLAKQAFARGATGEGIEGLEMQGRERKPWPFLHMVGAQPLLVETMQACSDPLAWICKKFSSYLPRCTCHFQLGQDLTQYAHFLHMLHIHLSFPPHFKFNPADLRLYRFQLMNRDEFKISGILHTWFYLDWQGNIRR